MVQRIFGAIKGAGTQIREVSGGRGIETAELGYAGIVGILERGAPYTPIFMLTRKDAEAKIGDYIAESLAPDAIYDYMREANGAGGIVAIRVTDGNELPSELPLYARQIPRAPIGFLKAKNGGRWGGAEARKYAATALLNDIGETTVTTGIAMKVDEWKGATLTLAGVPNVAYTVVGNDSAGVLSVDLDKHMATDLAAGADPSNKNYYLLLQNGDKHLAVVFSDGDTNPTTEFACEIYLNGELVIQWRDLSVDPDSENYWVSIINDDTSNEYVTAVQEWNGAITASVRPANHYGTFSAITATTMTATIHDFVIDGSGNPTFALGTTTDEMIAQTITLTMTTATAFDAVSDVFGAIGSGTFGVAFVPTNKWIPPFTVTAGATPMTAADEITVNYKPFVARSLIGGRLYPDKDSVSTLSYRIIDNTHKVITVASGSKMSTDVAPVVGTAASGSITWATKANHVSGEKIVLNDGVTSPITFWISVDGAYAPPGGYNATNIELDLTAATTNQEVAGVFKTAIDALPPNFKISSAAPAGGATALTNDSVGAQGNVAIQETVTHVSFSATGMSGGVNASTNEFMVEFRQQFAKGRDGNSEIVDSHYEAAWSLDSSPFLQLRGSNLGTLEFATPGVTAAAVQKAGVEYAYAQNHNYSIEIPPNITTEIAADSYLTNTIGRSVKTAYATTHFPSYGYVADPKAPKKMKRVPLTGMILGYQAQLARDLAGYQKAAAGIDALLPKLLKLTTGNAILNEEFLNPRGINVVKKRKGNFIVWGDRTLQSGDPEWTFRHQRKLMSHYENTLLENLDQFIFQINDPATQDDAKVALITFFRPEYVKRALRGDTFEQACIIKIDAENNTDLTMSQGDMHAAITLKLAETVERFVITIGKQGVNENVA